MKPSSLPEWAAYAKKAIAAAVGLALNLVALGVVPDEYLPWVQGVIAFLTVIGVYTARNTSPVDDPTTSTAVEAAVDPAGSEPDGVAADAPLEPVDDYQPRHALTTVDDYDHSDDEYPLED